MRTPLRPRVVASVVAGLALSAVAAPAAQAGDRPFWLAAGGSTVHGVYRAAGSAADRPIVITGRLTVAGRPRCAVVQVSGNGPADELVWRTATSLCARKSVRFTVRTGPLWGGASPAVRLCTGGSVRRATDGRHCDLYQPPLTRPADQAR
jgi:hypothetical protein